MNNLNELLLRGKSNYLNGQLDNALNDFNLVIKLDNQSYKAYNDRAIIQNKFGNPFEALIDLNRSIEINPEYFNSVHNRAIIKNLLFDYEEAHIDFSHAEILDSQNSELYFNRSGLKLQNLDFEGSLEDLSIAIKLRSEIKYYLNSSYIRRLLNDIQGSKNEYEEADKLSSEMWPLFLYPVHEMKFVNFMSANEAQWMINDADLDIVKLEKWQSEDENKYLLATEYWRRGCGMENIQEFTYGVEDYTKSINNSPNFKSFLGRGNCYLYLGKYNEALEDYNVAEEMNGNDSELFFNRGVLNYQRKYFSNAINDFNTAIILNPIIPIYYGLRGSSKKKLGYIDGYNKDIQVYLAITKSFIKNFDFNETYSFIFST